MTRRAVVIVSSTRAAAGTSPDATGPVIVEWLSARGFETDAATVVADGPDVEAALRAAVGSRADLIVTTGGTGIGRGDGTADATARLVTVSLPGFHEELRRRGSATTPFALMSRGVAGVAGSSFIVNLPGSSGGVRDGLQLLGEVVDHVLDQLAGGNHDG
ncbi:MAG: molybdenum cofactor synthesis domain-containing protein [Mycetocola sp.]